MVSTGNDLIKAMIFLVVLWAGTSLAPAGVGVCPAVVAQVQADSELSQPQIERLIDLLSSEKFAERELATNRLTDAGEEVVPALKKAAKSPVVEVRIRAERILADRVVEGESELSETDQALIEQFRTSSARGRLLMLRTHATSKKPKLFLRLVELDLEFAAKSQGQLQPAIETYMATNSAVFSNLLSAAIAGNDWDAVDHIVKHPVTQRFSPLIRAFSAIGRGEFDRYVDDAFERLRKQHENNAEIVESDLVSLIGMLRLRKDFERADQAIAWLPDQVTRDLIRRKIVFQRGDWGEVLRRSQLDVRDSSRIAANDTQTALMQYLARDEKGLAATIENIRTKLDDAIAALPKTKQAQPGQEGGQEEKNDEEKAKPLSADAAYVQKLKGDLRLIGIVTLDWNLTQEFLGQEELEEDAEFLLQMNRAGKAMELLQASGTFGNRHARMKQVLGDLRKAQDELMKRSSNRRGESYLRLKADERKLSTTALLIAEWAENHGLDDEAQLYYQMIVAADKSNSRTYQQEALDKLLELGRVENYWQVARSMMLGPDKQKFAGRVIYGVGSLAAKTLARQWSAGIRGSIQDPVLEAKTIAAVVNSPWVDTDTIDFDLEYEIAQYCTNSRLTTDGIVEFNLSQVYELHGDDEASERLLQQSVELGYTRATATRFQQAVATNDGRTILDLWFDSFRGYASASRGLIASHAAERLLESGSLDAAEKASIQEQLYRSQVAVMSAWHGNSPWLSSGMRELAMLEAEHLSILPLKAIVFGVNGDPRTSQRMELALVGALASKNSDQKMEAAAMSATVLFEGLGFDSANVKSSRGWISDVLTLHFVWAKGLIEQGKYEQATDVLIRVAGFSLGDVSAGEEAIGLLQQAGADEQADRLYRAIADHYIETLQEYPDSPLARNNLAWLSACAKRDLAAAHRHAKTAVAIRPNTVQYLDTLAEIEFLLGNFEKAFQLSKRCVQLYPSRFYYRQQKARFLEAKNK